MRRRRLKKLVRRLHELRWQMLARNQFLRRAPGTTDRPSAGHRGPRLRTPGTVKTTPATPASPLAHRVLKWLDLGMD
jgi:hypothetical protein